MYLLIKHEAMLLFRKFLENEIDFFHFDLEISRLHMLSLERFSNLDPNESERLTLMAETAPFEDFYDDVYCLLETGQMKVSEIRSLISSRLKEFIK